MKRYIILIFVLISTVMAENSMTEETLTQEERFEMLFGEVVNGQRVFRDVREKREDESRTRYRDEMLLRY